MKKDKDKSKKSHESTIGKIIYGFLLFLPLLAIGTTCLISTFNMSTKEEAEITYKYESNEVNSSEDLLEGHIYSFNYANLDYQGIVINESSFSRIKPLTNFRVEDTQFDEIYIDDSIISFPVVNIGFSGGLIYINFDEDGDNYVSFSYFEVLDDFVGILIEDNGLDYRSISYTDYNEIESVETHNVSAEDVFYKSVDKVIQSPLFNWTTNSLLYTGMNEFTTSLSITTPFIPLLLTYWLIISVVYFLYDIVLVILTVLHRKIHNLQDSI